MYKYVPKIMSREEVDEGLKKLVGLSNDNKYNPFDMVISSMNFNLCANFGF